MISRFSRAKSIDELQMLDCLLLQRKGSGSICRNGYVQTKYLNDQASVNLIKNIEVFMAELIKTEDYQYTRGRIRATH